MNAYEISSYEVEVVRGNNIRVEGSRDEETMSGTDAKSTVEAYLRKGDYRDGGDERVVVVEVDGEYFAEYTAPEIRDIQQAAK